MAKTPSGWRLSFTFQYLLKTSGSRPITKVIHRECQQLDRHLSLSTNSIEKVSNLAGLENLEILSLGRNIIKKLENLEPLAATLQELWISYNILEKLVGSSPIDRACTILKITGAFLLMLPC